MNDRIPLSEIQLRTPRDEADQPLPTPSDRASMHDVVIAKLQARKELGFSRYGSLLQAHNGRDARRDLSDELYDAIVYAEQMEQEARDLDAAMWKIYSALSKSDVRVADKLTPDENAAVLEALSRHQWRQS